MFHKRQFAIMYMRLRQRVGAMTKTPYSHPSISEAISDFYGPNRHDREQINLVGGNLGRSLTRHTSTPCPLARACCDICAHVQSLFP